MTETLSPTLELLHIGGPTVRFRYAGLSWLTDPTFDQPGDYPSSSGVTLYKLTGPAIPAAQVGKVDVVLLSHDQHFDNLDVSGRELLADAGLVLSTPDAAGRMEDVRGLANWESLRIGEVEVTGVPAQHGPEGAEALFGVVTGFVLRSPGWPTVYVSGDNAAVAVVERIVAHVGRIDIALLNVGAANVGRVDADLTLNAHTALEAARVLGDAVIIPVHAEGWHHFTETLDRLSRTFEYGGRADQLRIPPLGTETTVSL